MDEIMDCVSLSKQFIHGKNIAVTLEATDHKDPMIVCFGWSNSKSQGLSESSQVSPTIKATRGGEPAVVVLNDQGGGVMDVSDKAGTLRAQEHGHQPVVCFGVDCRSLYLNEEKSATLQAKENGGYSLNYTNPVLEVYPEVTGALCANSHPGSYTGQDAFNNMLQVIKMGRKYVLRRLTPVECSRLQGFPDWWVDGVQGADSNVYKMWGNGIALPCAADVIGRLAKELEVTND